MHTSRVIEIDGEFVGAAVSLPCQAGWRFVAADDRLGGLTGTVAPTFLDTQRLARAALLASRSKLRLHELSDA